MVSEFDPKFCGAMKASRCLLLVIAAFSLNITTWEKTAAVVLFVTFFSEHNLYLIMQDMKLLNIWFSV